MVESSPADGPLAASLRARGARFVEPWPGVRIPDDFGDPQAEYRALVAGRALVDASGWPELRLGGADRMRFLNGLVTCKLSDREPGEVVYGFFTDVKGRILADGWFRIGDDAIRVALPPGAGPAIAAHVTKYKIADRVDVELSRPARLVLPGEDGSGLGWDPLPPRHERVAEVSGVAVRAARRPFEGLEGLVVTVDPEPAERVYEALLDGRTPAGHAALDLARIETGAPRYGRDFDDGNFPQETGIDEGVAYDKGCYLGQEVVARIHYRGGVNRHLRGLEIGGDAVPETGTEVVLEGRPLGILTSVARSPRLGRVVGLSILHRRGAQSGTEVEVGEARARVVELPFA